MNESHSKYHAGDEELHII